jgi:hypothetical protein
MDSEPAIEESRFSVSLGVAVALDADDRGRVSAALASQRQVAEEGVLGDATTAKQELPRYISEAPTGAARSPQMTVAFILCLGDRSWSANTHWVATLSGAPEMAKDVSSTLTYH